MASSFASNIIRSGVSAAARSRSPSLARSPSPIPSRLRGNRSPSVNRRSPLVAAAEAHAGGHVPRLSGEISKWMVPPVRALNAVDNLLQVNNNHSNSPHRARSFDPPRPTPVPETEDSEQVVFSSSDFAVDKKVLKRSWSCQVVRPGEDMPSHHCSRQFIGWDSAADEQPVLGPNDIIHPADRALLFDDADDLARLFISPHLTAQQRRDQYAPVVSNEKPKTHLFTAVRKTSSEEHLAAMENARRELHRSQEEIRPKVHNREDIELLGSGGFGSVFEARYNGRKVAVKQFHNRGGKKGLRQIIVTLLCEMNAFRLSVHPNIVETISYANNPIQSAQIIYEYAGKENLQSLLDKTDECLGFKRAHRYATHIARALEHIHLHGVVHMDVKPANVMVTDNDYCKLADFGSSKFLAPHVNEAHVACHGTMIYTAPELLRRNRVSRASDVYSFGLCVWQLISGQVPFSDVYGGAQAIAYKVVKGGLRPDCNLPGLIADERQMLKIAQQCWVQEAADRPTATQARHLFECLQPDKDTMHF